MLIAILILLIFCALISFFSEKINPHILSAINVLIMLAMLFLSGLRPGAEISDFSTYELIFENFDSDKYSFIEPSFLWLCSVVNNLGGTIRWVIWIYAICTIPLKFWAFNKLVGPHVLLVALPVYLANFFQLHDCEQIRLALALSLAFIGFWQKTEYGGFRWIIPLIGALFFHVTIAFLFIPLLLTPNTDLTNRFRWTLVGFLFLGILIGSVGINPFQHMPTEMLQHKMELYQNDIELGEHEGARLINLMVIIRIALVCYICYFYQEIREHMKCVNLLLICEVLGIFSWFALHSAAVVFATRVSELFEVGEVFLFGSIYYTTKPHVAGKVIAFAIAIIFFAFSYKYNQFGFR